MYLFIYLINLLEKSIWMKRVLIISFGLLSSLSGDSGLPILCSTLWLFYVCSSRDLYEHLLQVAVIKCASSWSSSMIHRGLSVINPSLSCTLWTNPWRKSLSWKSIHLVVVSLHRLQPFLVLLVYLNGGSNHLMNYKTRLEKIPMLLRGCLLCPPTFTQPRTTLICFLSLVVEWVWEKCNGPYLLPRLLHSNIGIVRDCAPSPFYEGQTHVNGWIRVVASQNGGSTSYIFPFRLRVLQWSRRLFNYWKNKKTIIERFFILLIWNWIYIDHRKITWLWS